MSLFSQPRDVRRLRRGLIAAAATALLCAAPAQAAERPSLRIVAPQQVAAGQPVTVKLVLSGAGRIAGWEARLRFDTAAAEFAGVARTQLGTGRLAWRLGPVETGDGIAVGGFTRKADPQAVTTLVRVRLLPRVSGRLVVNVGDVRLVDRAGHRIALRYAARTVKVQVGSGGALRKLPIAVHLEPADRPPLRVRSGDLDGDGLVLTNDLTDASRAWDATRETGACAAAADVTGDGCVDVSDMVRVAGAVRPRPFALIPAADGLFTVDSTADTADATPGDGICRTATGVCTLRAAMTEANQHAGPDTIAFNLPGSGVQTIQISSQLPTMSDLTGPTTIDGYTQPGSSPNTSATADNAVLRVQVRGTGATLAYYMFFITSPDNVVRGLAIFNGRGMAITSANARNNRIVGNFIGTDAAGTFAFATLLRNCTSIELARGASQNRIGTPAPADRNVISGSAFTGIYFTDVGTNGNLVQNNIIGLTPSGNTRLRNQRMGVDINLGAAQNLIGGAGQASAT